MNRGVDRRDQGHSFRDPRGDFTFEKALAQLRDEQGALNFKAVADVIPTDLKPPLIYEVRDRITFHISSALYRGQFGDLVGADQLMSKTGTKVIFPQPVIERINDLLPKTDAPFLVSIAFTQDATGPDPENIERARRKLAAHGFGEEELSDPQVIEFLRLRHILGELHSRKVSSVRGEALMNQLTNPRNTKP